MLRQTQDRHTHTHTHTLAKHTQPKHTTRLSIRTSETRKIKNTQQCKANNPASGPQPIPDADADADACLSQLKLLAMA